MLKQGTINDKVTALTMIVQREPQRALTYLTNLTGLAKKNNRKQAEPSIGALRDLYITYLLTDNQKLYTFSKNPLILHHSNNESQLKEKDLLQAYYEHCTKELYRDFINNVLEPITHDDLEFYRKYSLNCLQILISSKPEMEETILSIIVNKLGDQSKKIQCHTIYLLIQLMKAHFEMTEVIVREVSLFMSRPNTKASHRFYAVAFLNRAAMSVAPKDEKVRVMLFKIYFNMF
jgi:ribosome biogenesis protein MAK21